MTSTHRASKVDQIVRECFVKVAHIILEARIVFPDITSHTKTNKWFNLEMVEVPSIKQEVRDWAGGSEPNYQRGPLVISVVHDLTGKSKDEVLLEQWRFSYTPGINSGTHTETGAMYKRAIIFLRSLYAYVRTLPVYALIKNNHEARLRVKYEFSDDPGQPDFSQVPHAEFRFSPVETPLGQLELSVVYRQTTGPGARPESGDTIPFTPGDVILDYVPRDIVNASTPAAQGSGNREGGNTSNTTTATTTTTTTATTASTPGQQTLGAHGDSGVYGRGRRVSDIAGFTTPDRPPVHPTRSGPASGMSALGGSAGRDRAQSTPVDLSHRGFDTPHSQVSIPGTSSRAVSKPVRVLATPPSGGTSGGGEQGSGSSAPRRSSLLTSAIREARQAGTMQGGDHGSAGGGAAGDASIGGDDSMGAGTPLRYRHTSRGSFGEMPALGMSPAGSTPPVQGTHNSLSEHGSDGLANLGRISPFPRPGSMSGINAPLGSSHHSTSIGQGSPATGGLLLSSTPPTSLLQSLGVSPPQMLAGAGAGGGGGASTGTRTPATPIDNAGRSSGGGHNTPITNPNTTTTTTTGSTGREHSTSLPTSSPLSAMMFARRPSAAPTAEFPGLATPPFKSGSSPHDRSSGGGGGGGGGGGQSPRPGARSMLTPADRTTALAVPVTAVTTPTTTTTTTTTTTPTTTTPVTTATGTASTSTSGGGGTSQPQPIPLAASAGRQRRTSADSAGSSFDAAFLTGNLNSFVDPILEVGDRGAAGSTALVPSSASGSNRASDDARERDISEFVLQCEQAPALHVFSRPPIAPTTTTTTTTTSPDTTTTEGTGEAAEGSIIPLTTTTPSSSSSTSTTMMTAVSYSQRLARLHELRDRRQQQQLLAPVGERSGVEIKRVESIDTGLDSMAITEDVQGASQGTDGPGGSGVGGAQ